MPLRYDMDDFDRHHCLKPAAAMIVVIAFLARDFLLPLAAAATRLIGVAGADLSWIYVTRAPNWYLVELPALALLFAWLRRGRSGDGLTRWIWRNGRWLLLGSAVAQSYPLLVLLRSGGTTHVTVELVIAAICALIIVYLAGNLRVRDVFASFPAPAETR